MKHQFFFKKHFPIYVFAFCLLISNWCSAQNPTFATIDKYATSAPISVSGDLDQLCAYLIKPAKNDTEKIRSIYVWISNNIKYDMKGLLAEKLPPYDVNTVFKSRLAVCLGIANLFEAMCKKVGVPAFVVDGYSKGFGYIEGKRFAIPDHAWNAVYINNQWYHIDATWDVTTTNLPDFYPYREFKGDFFLVPSEEFIVNHLSSDPVWQLSDYVLPLSDFEKADIDAVKLSPPKKYPISFKDTLSAFRKLDTTDAMIDYARRASAFNPKNSEAKILLALGYFYKGDALTDNIKKINAKYYEVHYKEYENEINSYYEKAYKVLITVKPGMKYYEEAKKSRETIDEYKIKTDVSHSTTLDENYKVNIKFKVLMLNKNIKMDVKKMDIVNSVYRETNLSISPDANLLFFKSERGGQPWSEKYTNFKGTPCFDGDIWYSKKLNGKWQAAQCVDKSINTSSGEDEPNISPDGKKLVFQSWKKKWKSTGGPYYIADLNNKNVKDHKGLGDGISRFFIQISNDGNFGTDGASMSPDGKRFIVSAGDYWKDLDLYMSVKDNNGKWGTMQALPFNTVKDERSVFIASDGITVFFASNGYGGFGGLDIFKTTIDENGNIGEIINLGNSINTKGDDYSFILSATGEEAYFIREGDIYEVAFKESVTEIMPGKSLVVKGKISRINEGKGNFTIKLSDEKKENEMTTEENKDGSFYFFLKNTSASYTISVFSDGIKMAEEILKADTVKNYCELIKDFSIDLNKKEKIIDTIVNRVRVREEIYEKGMFANINFEYNMFAISDEFNERLALIVKYLLAHKNAKLGIGGYSDVRGNAEFNQELSQKRAESAYQYFLKNGIDKKQLIVNAYGSQNPLTLDETIQGGWVNRRVEFTIVNAFPVRKK